VGAFHPSFLARMKPMTSIRSMSFIVKGVRAIVAFRLLMEPASDSAIFEFKS
jgi:hypothetical protein